MYKSPIELIVTEIENQVIEKGEEAICTAVLHYIPNVDRTELLKALEYDRQQYEAGYRDAKDEIVRCKVCKFGEMCSIREAMCCTDENGFCWRGERRTDGN